jgi:hypothetical protein
MAWQAGFLFYFFYFHFLICVEKSDMAGFKNIFSTKNANKIN